MMPVLNQKAIKDRQNIDTRLEETALWSFLQLRIASYQATFTLDSIRSLESELVSWAQQDAVFRLQA